MTTTTNWREMKPGIALDIEIIQRLPGWQIRYVADGSQAEYEMQFELEPPKHVTVIVDDGKYIFLRGPRYSIDVNSALALFAELPHDFMPRLVRVLQPMGDHMDIRWKAAILGTGARIAEVVAEESDTPALAICRAWLAWRETQ